jgi:signal transduction histidine kinase
MSHELRTPLNAIRGFTELLELEVHGPVSAAQRECLGRIKRSEQHLLGLIGEILEHARLEAGRVEYATTTCAPPAWWTRCSPGCARTPSAPGSRWTGALWTRGATDGGALDGGATGRACDGWMRGDPQRVRQIVVNLLSNALKFTPRGGRVVVRCHDGVAGGAGASPGGEPRARCPPASRCATPDSASRRRSANGSSSRSCSSGARGATRWPGSGSGWRSAASSRAAMGGDLVVDDAPEGGACFRLTLPAAPVVRRGSGARGTHRALTHARPSP